MNPLLTSAYEKLRSAFEEMKLEPNSRLTKNSVAKRAGVNHAMFYKNQPDIYSLKLEIEEEERLRKTKLKTEQLQLKCENFEKRLDASKRKQESISKNDDGFWIEKLLEMYRYNDQLSEQLRNYQYSELQISEVIDLKTGEVKTSKSDAKKRDH